MSKLTAEEFNAHLHKVVDPNILDQVSPESLRIALDGINKALGTQPQTERGGHAR